MRFDYFSPFSTLMGGIYCSLFVYYRILPLLCTVCSVHCALRSCAPFFCQSSSYCLATSFTFTPPLQLVRWEIPYSRSRSCLAAVSPIQYNHLLSLVRWEPIRSKSCSAAVSPIQYNHLLSLVRLEPIRSRSCSAAVSPLSTIISSHWSDENPSDLKAVLQLSFLYCTILSSYWSNENPRHQWV